MKSLRLLTAAIITTAALPFLSLSANAASCVRPVTAAFTGPLTVNSKYEGSDRTRSQIGSVDSHSVAIRDYMNAYSAAIVSFADYYDARIGTPGGRVALECLTVWLNEWARAGAMTTQDSTPTGQAVRVWALASIASAIIKVQARGKGEFKLSQSASNWLQRLSAQVVADYEIRFTSKASRMNNHDYWGAWAVAAVDIATGSQGGMNYSYRVFQHAMNNTAIDRRTGVHYLPNETRRGNLGLHYTQFAMTPLVMLARYLPENGYVVTYQESLVLDSLVTFGLGAFLQKSSYQHIFGSSQKQPSADSFTWARVYTDLHPDNDASAVMVGRYGKYLSRNSRIGGDLTRLYP